METGFFDTVGTRDAAVGPMATPESVAQAGLRALEQGCPSGVPGWRNRLQVALPRFVPRGFIVKIAAQMMKPRAALAPALTPGAAPARR